MARKDEILRQAGFEYDRDRTIYFNRKAKKVLSYEFVEDHREDKLVMLLNEKTERDEWRFYSISPLSEATMREIENVIG